MRYTEYHAGKAVIKDKSLLSEAMEKLAKYEDAEEKDRLGQWILCSKRLPEDNTDVIVCFYSGTVTEMRYWGNGIFQGIYEHTTKVKAREFERFGFKRCKGIPKESECYYLCIARGCKMLFVSDSYFGVNDWDKDDPRIHKDANCRYRDNRTALDIIYELIKADILESRLP